MDPKNGPKMDPHVDTRKSAVRPWHTHKRGSPTGSIGWPNPAPLKIDNCLEIHNLHWELGESGVIKSPKFSARSTAPPLRLVHEETCESLPSRTLLSTRFPLNSCSRSGMSKFNRCPHSKSWSSFYLVLVFWLAVSTGRPVLFFQRVYMTQLLDVNLSHLDPPFFRLTVAWHSCGRGSRRAIEWSISCLESVMEITERKTGEELVDKPGTTIGTVPSRCRFSMRCGFKNGDPLVGISLFIVKLSWR